MRIVFERTGGVAGRKLEGSLDSSALPGAEVEKLEKLLRESAFFSQPSVIESKAPGADQFRYRITVETTEESHTVEAVETAVPRSMRPLLDFLKTILTPAR